MIYIGDNPTGKQEATTMTRTDLTDQIEDNQLICMNIFPKRVFESQSSATSLTGKCAGHLQSLSGNVYARRNEDGIYEESTMDGVLSPYVAQSVKSATDCGRIE